MNACIKHLLHFSLYKMSDSILPPDLYSENFPSSVASLESRQAKVSLKTKFCVHYVTV